MRAAIVVGVLFCGWAGGCHSASEPLSGDVVIAGDSDASGVMVQAVGPIDASAVTDAAGHYRFPSLPPGSYELLFTAHDTHEKSQALAVEVESTLSAPTVRFTAVGSIAGAVTLAGQPGAGVTVFVDGAGAVATTDAGGAYRLDDVPAGSITVSAVLVGYQPGSLGGLGVTRGKVLAAPALDLAVDSAPIGAAAALAGTALRVDRADASGTMVTASSGAGSFETTTAMDGSYRFDGIPTGLYRLDFDYDGHHESIPQVLALGGSTGQIIDGALYPLETNPLELPMATRIATAGSATIVDANRALLVLPGATAALQKMATLDLGSGALTDVADDAVSGVPLLSSDGAHVLYLAGTADYAGALRVGSLDGTAPLTLAPLADLYGYRFTADGAHVVYSVNRQEIDIVPTAGGTPTALATSVQSYSWWLHPDGKRLVYFSCPTTTTCAVWARTLDGGTPAHVMDAAYGASFTMAPDGGHIAALVGYDSSTGTGQLFVAGVDSGTSTMLFDGAGAPSFSPDGRWLAFSDKTNLHIVDLAKATPSAVTVAAPPYSLTFLPDGRFVYQSGPDQPSYTLSQQPAGGGSAITLGTQVHAFWPALDGTRILVEDQYNVATELGGLRVVDASGTATMLVAGGVSDAQLSRDGIHVEYTTADPTSASQSQLWSMLASGGAPVALGSVSVWYMRESPSGAHLAFANTDGNIAVLPTAGGAGTVAFSGNADWASESRLVLSLTDQPAPFSFQNGIYVFAVTP